MILPFEIRNGSKPVAIYGLPVAGLPNNGPVLFHYLSILSTPYLLLQEYHHVQVFYLVQATSADAYFFAPSGPLRSSSGRTGL